jgi:hypothetical protein
MDLATLTVAALVTSPLVLLAWDLTVRRRPHTLQKD